MTNPARCSEGCNRTEQPKGYPMKKIRMSAAALAALAVTTTATAASPQSQGDGNDRYGFINCYSPAQVVVHGHFWGKYRLAVKDPINGQNFTHVDYGWSKFISDPTPDGNHLEWHVANVYGHDSEVGWADKAFAECVTFARPKPALGG